MTNREIRALEFVFESASWIETPNIEEIEIAIDSRKSSSVDPLGYLWNIHITVADPTDNKKILSQSTSWNGAINVVQENWSMYSPRNVKCGPSMFD